MNILEECIWGDEETLAEFLKRTQDFLKENFDMGEELRGFVAHQLMRHWAAEVEGSILSPPRGKKEQHEAVLFFLH